MSEVMEMGILYTDDFYVAGNLKVAYEALKEKFEDKPNELAD